MTFYDLFCVCIGDGVRCSLEEDENFHFSASKLNLALSSSC